MPLEREKVLEQQEWAENDRGNEEGTHKSRGISMVAALPGGPQTGTLQWESIMRRFHESQVTACKAIPETMPAISRSLKKFPTGSTYEGTWDLFGMSGRGTYVFPQGGVKYVGDFKDGMFDGEGGLQYETGAVIKGKWHKGVPVQQTLFFADGLEYCEQNWMYCKFPDRRFTVEYNFGLEPAGRENLTAEKPVPNIPDGMYDVGDGFYEPITKTVYKYDDLTSIVRSPCSMEQSWILENCRKMPDTPRGPMPFLYEEWTNPTLEKEYPPPAAVRTKIALEEAEWERQEREEYDGGHCASGKSISYVKESRLEGDFYKPDYLLPEASTQQSQVVNDVSGVSIKKKCELSSSQIQRKISRGFDFDEGYFISMEASVGDDLRESGFIEEAAGGLPNW